MTASLFSSPVAMPDLSTLCAWAGIGSRQTPADVLSLMTRIARRMAELGHTLRSGAAPKADTAFEAGHREVCGVERLEIYLPKPNFEREARAKRQWVGGIIHEAPSDEAMVIASRIHPYWHGLKSWEKPFHGRNSYQILGRDLRLEDAVQLVLCWTPDGATSKTTSRTGGTGQAIRLGSRIGAFVHNLQREDHRRAWERWLDG